MFLNQNPKGSLQVAIIDSCQREDHIEHFNLWPRFKMHFFFYQSLISCQRVSKLTIGLPRVGWIWENVHAVANGQADQFASMSMFKVSTMQEGISALGMWWEPLSWYWRTSSAARLRFWQEERLGRHVGENNWWRIFLLSVLVAGFKVSVDLNSSFYLVA